MSFSMAQFGPREQTPAPSSGGLLGGLLSLFGGGSAKPGNSSGNSSTRATGGGQSSSKKSSTSGNASGFGFGNSMSARGLLSTFNDMNMRGGLGGGGPAINGLLQVFDVGRQIGESQARKAAAVTAPVGGGGGLQMSGFSDPNDINRPKSIFDRLPGFEGEKKYYDRLPQSPGASSPFVKMQDRLPQAPQPMFTPSPVSFAQDPSLTGRAQSAELAQSQSTFGPGMPGGSPLGVFGYEGGSSMQPSPLAQMSPSMPSNFRQAMGNPEAFANIPSGRAGTGFTVPSATVSIPSLDQSYSTPTPSVDGYAGGGSDWKPGGIPTQQPAWPEGYNPYGPEQPQDQREFGGFPMPVEEPGFDTSPRGYGSEPQNPFARAIAGGREFLGDVGSGLKNAFSDMAAGRGGTASTGLGDSFSNTAKDGNDPWRANPNQAQQAWEGMSEDQRSAFAALAPKEKNMIRKLMQGGMSFDDAYNNMAVGSLPPNDRWRQPKYSEIVAAGPPRYV